MHGDALKDLFPGFRTETVRVDGAEIFCRIGGNGSPLLLLHGFPQSHVMWHTIAARLACDFTVVAADLRGYGASSAPPGDSHHNAYSKRTMAGDMIAVMDRLGFEKFAIAGHDRGGRVAYRMAFDHPERLTRVAVLDILTTYDYWQRIDWQRGLRVYHWMFLAQPHPLPERLIACDARNYLEHTLASWTKKGTLDAFGEAALDHYRAFFIEPARIHALCEDYRAGATVDMDQDTADRERGNKISLPLLALYGDAGFAGGDRTPGDVWRGWAKDVREAAVDAGHFLVEENPDGTYDALHPFLMEDLA